MNFMGNILRIILSNSERYDVIMVIWVELKYKYYYRSRKEN